jgi:cytochrome bd-type quinol oxidase subunit 2
MEDPGGQEPRPSERTGLVTKIAVGLVCAVLGGLSSCGMGGTFQAMLEPLGRLGGPVSNTLGILTGAVISLATGAAWLRTDLRRVARRLWWVYLLAALLGLYGLRGSLVSGPRGGYTVGAWGWLWVSLFSGAWPSLLLCAVVAVWTAVRPERQ